MKEVITRFCEDCKIRLITKPAYDRCFNANHDIRVSGQFVVPVAMGGTMSATALNDAKAGESVLFKLT